MSPPPIVAAIPAPCDDFQVDVEKRLHGALGEAGQQALAAHLATCERCRRYEGAARGTEAAMAGRARVALAAAEPPAFPPGGGPGGVSGGLRVFAAVAGLAAWMAAMVLLSTPAPFRQERIVRTMPSLVVLAVLVAFVAAYSGRRLTALADRGEVLDTWRHRVAANLQWARRMQLALAAVVAFLLYKALQGRAARYDPTVYFGGLALPVAGAWLFLRRVEMPRLEREARDLGILAGERG